MNPYAVLDVPKNSDAGTIRKAYRRKAKKAHPDRAGGSTEQMASINAAYALLSDTAARERYDATGDARSIPPLDEMARKMLMELFNAASDQLAEHVDVIDAMRRKIDLSKAEMRSAVANSSETIRKAERQMKALKWKGESTPRNFFADVLAERIAQAKGRTFQAERAMEVAEKALELLQDFGWECTEPAQPIRSFYVGMFTTGTGT